MNFNFASRCIWSKDLQVSIRIASLVTAVLNFFSLWQIPAAISISTTPKPFCFHWWTSQDGHLLNCLKQEDIVLTEHIPYVFVHRMGPHSVEDMTFKFSTPDNPCGNSHSNLGHTYSAPSGHSYGSTFAKTFLAGTYNFTPDEVETFYESN